MKVVHEEYLRAFLDGVTVQRKSKSKFDTCKVWEDFDLGYMALHSFNADAYIFRYKPKVIEVILEDFYAEYDSGVPMCEIIEKYLPRDCGKWSKNNK